MTEGNYWLGSRRMSRRGVLKGSALGGVGLAGAALMRCSDPPLDTIHWTLVRGSGADHPIVDELGHDARIGERRNVTELLGLVRRDLAEDPSHDLA